MIQQQINARFGVPLTGDAATAISFHKISARINPASTAPYLGSGMAVKLVAGTPTANTEEILVDAIAAATDKVYGTIFYNMKNNLHRPGEDGGDVDFFAVDIDLAVGVELAGFGFGVLVVARGFVGGDDVAERRGVRAVDADGCGEVDVLRLNLVRAGFFSEQF